MSRVGIVLQLISSYWFQPGELDIENESRGGRDDFTKPTGTWGVERTSNEGHATLLLRRTHRMPSLKEW